MDKNYVVFIYNDTLTGYGSYTDGELLNYNGVSRFELYTNEADMLRRVEELENS